MAQALTQGSHQQGQLSQNGIRHVNLSIYISLQYNIHKYLQTEIFTNRLFMVKPEIPCDGM